MGNVTVGIGKGLRSFLADTDYVLAGHCHLSSYLMSSVDGSDTLRVKLLRSMLRSVVSSDLPSYSVFGDFPHRIINEKRA